MGARFERRCALGRARTLMRTRVRRQVARRLLREVEIELGGSTLGARAAGYELEYNRRRSQLDELQRSVSLGRERHALFGAHSPRPGELSSLGPREILARAEAVQDESVAAVHRMHRMASSALEIGQETLGSLGAQRERVRNLAATAAALDAQLNLAGLELHHFIGKMCAEPPTRTRGHGRGAWVRDGRAGMCCERARRDTVPPACSHINDPSTRVTGAVTRSRWCWPRSLRSASS